MATSKGKKAAKPTKQGAPAKKKPAPARPAPAKRAPAKKAPAAKATAAKKKPAPAKPAPAKKAPAKKAPAAKATAAKQKPAPAKEPAPKKPLPETPPQPAPAPAPSAPDVPAGRVPPRKPEPKAYRPKARIGPDGTLILEEDKILNKAFYAGQQMPSPMGGFLQLLGVRSRPDGSAVAHLECSASSLRYLLELSKATKSERARVREIQVRGEDPDCPRHGAGIRLLRAGKDLLCPLCGIAYGRV